MTPVPSYISDCADSKSFIIGNDKGTLHLWSLNGKSEIRAIRSPNGLDRIVYLAFSPGGKTLGAIHGGKRWTAEGTAVVWNRTDWTALCIDLASRLPFCASLIRTLLSLPFPALPAVSAVLILAAVCATFLFG